MFDNIAANYDFLNSLLSVGIDRYWRKETIDLLPFSNDDPPQILDLATGTGVLAIQTARRFPKAEIKALDISSNMIQEGIKRIAKEKLQNQIELIHGDAENLPFEDNSFDAVMIAFGVRNFEDTGKGLREMLRVLKPGGLMLILEFSKIRIFPFNYLFQFYFKYILPVIGRILSKDPKAYTYLFESVQHFPDYERFTAIMEEQNIKHCSYLPLTLGICTIYRGIK